MSFSSLKRSFIYIIALTFILAACLPEPDPPASITLSVSQAEQGQTITASLENLNPEKSQVSVADIAAEVKARFGSGVSFTIPETVPTGSQTVIVSDGEKSASSTLEITTKPIPASITLSTTEASPNDTLSANLEGLDGSSATVTVANLEATVTERTDSSIAFVVPSNTPQGQQTVVIAAQGKSASATINITLPSITLGKSQVLRGDTVSASLIALDGNTASVTVAGNDAEITDRTATSLNFTVPDSTPLGTQVVTIKDDKREASASIELVEAGFSLDKTYVSRQETITLFLTGIRLPAQAALTLSQSTDVSVLVDGLQAEVTVLDTQTLEFIIPKRVETGVNSVELIIGQEKLSNPVNIIGDDVVSDEIVVVFNPGLDETILEAQLGSFGLSLIDENVLNEDRKLFPLGGEQGSNDENNFCTGELGTIKIGQQTLGEAIEFVESQEQNGMPVARRANPRSGPSIDTIDYLATINADSFQNTGLRGEGITIAILDTGVDASSELSGRLLTSLGKDFINNDDSPNDDYARDSFKHGTPIAILAAGSTQGIAPDASIMPIKVCDSSGTCPSTALIKGLCYALNNAPNGLDKLVLNTSLGGETPLDIIEGILEYANSKGTLVAAAAGNDGPGVNLNYPAAYRLDNILGVAALEASERTCLNFTEDASYSTGQTYNEGGSSVSFEPFEDTFGEIYEQGSAFTGLGNFTAPALELNGISASFDFGTTLSQVSFDISGFDGDIYLELNGDVLKVDDQKFPFIDGSVLGGVQINLSNDMMTLVGDISSMTLGSQFMRISNLCPLAQWRVASFSSRGNHIDLAAPGAGIFLAGLDTEAYNGSSFATPLAAGALALYRQALPTADPINILDRLKSDAKPVPGGTSSTVGAGRLWLENPAP